MYNSLLRKVLWRNLPTPLTTQLLEQGVISRFVVYAVLLNPLAEDELARMDTAMAAAGKHNMGLPISAPRGTPFAPNNSFGGGLPSAVTHFIAGIARELDVLINQIGYLGALARNSMIHAIKESSRLEEDCFKNSLIVTAVNTLSRWGIQSSCAMEPLVSRMRDELLKMAISQPGTERRNLFPCFSARPIDNKRACEFLEKHSLFGKVANSIRDWVGEDEAPIQPT
jgi:hypothetical protein